MDEEEIKIEKLEHGPEPILTEKEPESKVSKEDATPTDNKSIIIALAIIIGVFGLAIAGMKIYNYFAASSLINIDDLHKENLEEGLAQKEGYVYNGYSFVYVDGLWWTEVNRFGTLLKIPLHFGPKEVEEIKIYGKLNQTEFNQGDNVYIAINPNTISKYYTLAISELSFNVAKGIDKTPVGSCTELNPDCGNRTIISCNNTLGKPVIELAWENKTMIFMSGSCIKVTGEGYGLVKAVDRLLLQWYGVMN
ncbi:hypothetical protein HZC32_02755 [Candidatus Woesearchaeota archaeon]|nr:hypothetical protein [Candidatus Woesearchaeota archaeon]